MMNLQHLAPQCLSDFAFSSSVLEKATRKIADGTGSDHLILFGGPGTGKSLLAELIFKERFPALFDQIEHYRIEGRRWRDNETAVIEQQSTIAITGGHRSSIFIVNEADLLRSSEKEDLKSFIDNEAQRLGITFVLTTNKIGSFTASFLDRFLRCEVARPQREALELFVKNAFQEQERTPTQQQLDELLKCSSWRQLDKMLSLAL